MSGDILINMEQTHINVAICVVIDSKNYEVSEGMHAIASTSEAKQYAIDLLNGLCFELQSALEAERGVLTNVYSLKNQDND